MAAPVRGRAGAPVAVGEIAALLAADARRLAAELLPNGRRQGGEWVEARRAAGGLGDSLKVRLADGVWMHGAAGRAGDALDLVAYLACAGDKGEAVAWAKRFLGIEAGGRAPIARRLAAAATAARAAEARQARDAEGKRRAARAIWYQSAESLAGTPAARYLAGRGLDLARLGRQPRSLRYHPALANPESGRAWPALVAAILGGPGTRDDGQLVAVHRTWLEEHPDGSVGKAPLEAAKMTLGAYRGGAVRLWRGAAGTPLRAAAAGSWALLTEGLEDALAVALGAPHWRVLAAVSLANMAAVGLPPAVAGVVLAADNDDGNPQALAALDRAITAHARAGRRVRLARSPVGKDFNDLWLASDGATEETA